MNTRSKPHPDNAKGVRPIAFHLSDRVTKGFRRSSLPKHIIQSQPSGVVAKTTTSARGDYQCNLPMAIQSRYIRPLKLKSNQLPSTPTLNAGLPIAPGDKKAKKDKPPVAVNKVFSVPSQPHKFNPADDATLPETAHDLAYQSLSSIVDTHGVEIRNPNAHDPKKSSDFFPVCDTMLQGVSIARQGFLGLRLSNKYIAKRLVPFLTQNDAPPPLLFESDMKYITPSSSEPTYDDRPLSLIPKAHSTQNPSGFAPAKTPAKAIPLPAYPRVVTIDYSSPNIAKEMHVGHVRSTVIGDSLARILEFSGNTVQRINHLGDWGTQFGMLLCHFNDLLRKGVKLGDVGVTDLQGFYQTAKKRFDADSAFQTKAKEYVVKLQGGDQECREIWQQFCGLSRPSFQRIFQRLRIDPRLLERGESFYQPFLPDVIDELLASGVAIERDGVVLLPPQTWVDEQNKPQGEVADGVDSAATNPVDTKPEGTAAKKVNKGRPKEDSDKTKKANAVVRPTDEPDEIPDDEEDETFTDVIPDAVVLRKSDGGYTYGATDMASIRLRLLGSDCWFKQSNQPAEFELNSEYQNQLSSILPADWALYVVDSGQSIHFARIFEGATRAGWINRAQAIAQQRKVQYFHDIIDTLATNTSFQPNSQTQDDVNQRNENIEVRNGKHDKTYKIARSTQDGDFEDFYQQPGSKVVDTELDLFEHPELRVQHVYFGVVCGTDGKRLRTRAGKSIKLAELLDESVSRSKKIIEELSMDPAGSAGVDGVIAAAGEGVEMTAQMKKKQARGELLRKPEIQQQLAESIGYASIKYADLSKNRTGDYVFDFDKMLDLQGNTAGYLLYAHARLFSLLQRCTDAKKYGPIVQHLINMKDPFSKYGTILGYDYNFLYNSHHNDVHFNSTFDLMAQNPDLVTDILKGLNKDHENVENQHDVLVSAAIAQYASSHATDSKSVTYPRSHPYNDNIWTKSPSGSQRASPEFISSIAHSVSTIDPTYGVSFTPARKPLGQDVYSTMPTIALDHASERALGLHVAQFHDSIVATLYGLTPNNMTDYSMQLSHAFSAFYRDCAVLPKPAGDASTSALRNPVGNQENFSTANSRVLLTHSTAVTLQRSLDLIGIQPTKFM